MVPATYAELPLLPLTDTEIIVYFFNALGRPMVSLRLYARGWGPSQICDALNSHRKIEPEYLRNTCSVKCTTAIKKGREKFGENWEAENRAKFENTAVYSDDRATDMIRLAPDERSRASDFEIISLCQGLKKHPGEADGGIFTRCVKWCEENDGRYKLSNVWELASALDAGQVPKRIPSSGSSTSSSSLSTAQTVDTDIKMEDEDEIDINGNTESDDSVLGNDVKVDVAQKSV